ncbi:type III PLP-dependent enzyme [Nonomuraea purpurea]|uniref:Type III PLP-dependent enzyme n=1 Tax=Nonomuraea purpurea TaxID=1849276 RepID=A0ABV8GSA6_9ACTN
MIETTMDVDGELARRFGSPLYVYRLDDVEAAVSCLRDELPDGSLLYYSLKANPHPDLVAHLRARGCHAEISSPGELAAARLAGFDGRGCLYTGPAKTSQEITAALDAGVELFSVESATDFARVAQAASDSGVTARCLLRLATSPTGPAGLRLAGAPSQFGMEAAGLLAEPGRFADTDGARVVGLHFFPASNVPDEDGLMSAFTAAIALAASLRESGLRLDQVNLGGGFSAPYARPGERPRHPGLRRRLSAELDARLPGWRTGRPVIAFESGRHLVGGCGRLICTVADVKTRGEHTFVLLDSGVNHLGGLSGIGRMLPGAVPLADGGTSGGLVTFAGPLCTTADVLSRRAPAGPLSPGDFVVFPNVGAYGLTASLVAFLGRAAPAELVLRGTEIVSVSHLTISRTYD